MFSTDEPNLWCMPGYNFYVYRPTIPHCSLATLIGLCIRVKLEQNLPKNHKIGIFVAEGTHNTGEESMNWCFIHDICWATFILTSSFQ